MNPQNNPPLRRLVGAQQCSAEIFGDGADAPCARWWQYQMKRGIIPFYRIGRLVWFDPAEVREALTQQCRVAARTNARPVRNPALPAMRY
jgi:hypothetical protein